MIRHLSSEREIAMKDVRRDVIRNHFSDIETIDAILDGDLASWKELDVQHLVLLITAGVDIPVEIIERLSKHRSEDVRNAIAHRNDLPDNVIAKLARDTTIINGETISEVVASHCNCNDEIFHYLIDCGLGMYSKLASNEYLPIWAFEQIYATAKANLKSMAQIYIDMLEDIMDNKKCPTYILENAVHFRHMGKIYPLALSNMSLPESVLREALSNPCIVDNSTISSIINNLSAPDDIVIQALDMYVGKRKLAAMSCVAGSSASTSVLQYIIDRISNECDIDSVHYAFAQNKHTPTYFLEAYLNHNDMYMRRCAARNNGTPIDAIVANLGMMDREWFNGYIDDDDETLERLALIRETCAPYWNLVQ